MIVEDKEEMSLKDFILLIAKWLKYLRSKWLIILLVAGIGAASGFLRHYLAKPNFKAISTFVLDEEQSSGGGGSLAMLGLGGEEGGGLFQGDNLKWLYTTRAMIQKSLLTEVTVEGKNILLVDWFLSIDKDAIKMLKNDPSLKNVKFTALESDSLNNLGMQKSALLGACYSLVKGKYIKVKDVEKTEGVIEVTVTAGDEKFAKNLSDVLVQNVNSFYIQTKTQKVAAQVSELQQQASEYNTRMNASMYQTASAVDAVPYPNPNHQVNLIQPKRKSVDVELNSAIYTQIVRSLESSKMELAQATPLIQVIDAPLYPLPVDKPGLVMNVLLFGLITMVLTMVILIVRKVYKDALAN